MRKRLLFLIVILILVSSFVCAENYYADVVFRIQDNGDVFISGITNHPALELEQTSELTSKKGKYWKINISINDTFSNFVYEIQLPKNSVVNYMDLPDVGRIEDSSSGLKIIGTGENQKLEVVIQYYINLKKRTFDTFTYIILVIILGVLLYRVYLKKFKKKKNNIKLPGMTDRQKSIFNLIKKSKKPLTQKNIEEKLGLPKSSVSRNINSLQQKGLITKEQKGMSNIIKLKVPDSSGKFREN